MTPERSEPDVADQLNACKRYLAAWKSWPNGVTFPGIRNGDQLAEELLGMMRWVAKMESEMLALEVRTGD